MATQPHHKKRVSYFYDNDIGDFCYGKQHPMKPLRLKITDNLIRSYGLHMKMEICRPSKLTGSDMTQFHSDEYINFLRSITPDDITENRERIEYMLDKNMDCPIFKGLFEFCQLSAGGSVEAAIKLNNQSSDICINWSGGLHHAKRSGASGFCYVNDIVLGIIELLKHHQRVLYIDIDVHHGDGVETAFYSTDRVMTVSFHKYDGIFFPGTGKVARNGTGEGKHYTVNVPLLDGIDDSSYESLFVPIISKIVECYQPLAIVLQCGADSLTRDRLGSFNLTLRGHGKCVEFVKKFNLPLLILGGGGYTVGNVARCWTYETSVVLDADIPDHLPYNDYNNYYQPARLLHIKPTKMINKNTSAYLENTKCQVLENLRELSHAPAAQVHDIPEDAFGGDADYEDNVDKDERFPQSDRDRRIVPENEFFDCED